MSPSLQPSWSRPEPTASADPGARAGTPDAAPGSAASLLLSQGGVGRVDSRRIALGLVALALVSAALLNIGIYQSERSALAGRRWDQLARGIDIKRDEVRGRIWQLQRQSAYAAAHPTLVRWAGRGTEGSLTARERRELQLELDRTARALDLHHLDLIGPSGARLAGSQDAPATSSAAELDMIHRARETGQPAFALVRRALEGDVLIEIATVVPTTGLTGLSPVLVSAGLAEEALGTLFTTDWVMPGVTGHAYLVRLDDGEVSFLTSPEPGSAPPASVSLGDRHAQIGRAHV